jgi:hypothetical protein
MKMPLFCGVVPCSLADIDQHFRRVYHLHHRNSLVNIYQTTQHYIPVDSHLNYCNLVHCIASMSVSLFCTILTSQVSVTSGLRLTKHWVPIEQVSEMEVCSCWYHCGLGAFDDHVDVTIYRF